MSNFQFYESRIFSSILHLLALGQFFYAMHHLWNLNIPDVKGMPKMLRGYGGLSRFLTNWNLASIDFIVLQSVYTLYQLFNYRSFIEWENDTSYAEKILIFSYDIIYSKTLPTTMKLNKSC